MPPLAVRFATAKELVERAAGERAQPVEMGCEVPVEIGGQVQRRQFREP